MISQVFWTHTRKWAFQYVGGYFRVYDENGNYLTEFKDFEIMCDYILAQERGCCDAQH